MLKPTDIMTPRIAYTDEAVNKKLSILTTTNPIRVMDRYMGGIIRIANFIASMIPLNGDPLNSDNIALIFITFCVNCKIFISQNFNKKNDLKERN